MPFLTIIHTLVDELGITSQKYTHRSKGWNWSQIKAYYLFCWFPSVDMAKTCSVILEKRGDNSILYQPMINMQLFQRNNKQTLSLRTLYIVMNYENILHLPEICNFQEAINVRLALRTLRNALHPIKPWKYSNVVNSWAVYAKLNAHMAMV